MEQVIFPLSSHHNATHRNLAFFVQLYVRYEIFGKPTRWAKKRTYLSTNNSAMIGGRNACNTSMSTVRDITSRIVMSKSSQHRNGKRRIGCAVSVTLKRWHRMSCSGMLNILSKVQHVSLMGIIFISIIHSKCVQDY